MFKIKTDEERRNQEHEVSLVKALKNSYAGIEEIKITDPEYSDKLSDAWGADVTIIFSDKISIKHVLAYKLKIREIRIGVYTEEDEKVENILNSKKGITENTVSVTYSDGEKGEQ